MNYLHGALGLGLLTVHATGASALESAETELEHVVVTAPLHKTEAETAMPVMSLGGEDLRDVVSSSLGETLLFEPGISNTSYGPGVGKPVIRGQTGPRVLVLQNGLAVQDVSTLSPDHANATEPFLAERIEVIKGPASLLYGNGAIGGVVNVIDGRIPDAVPDSTQGGIAWRYNSVDDGNVSIFKLDTGAGAMALHLDGLYSENNDVSIPGEAIDIPGVDPAENTDGYIGNSNGHGSSITAGASWIQTWGYVGASYSQLKDNYGIPPGTHAGHEHAEEMEEAGAEPEIRIDMEQERFDLKSEIYHPLSWLEVSRIQLANTRYHHRELEGQEIGTTFENDAWSLRWEMVHHAFAGWHGAFGLDAATRDFSAFGEEVFVPESNTRNIGFFLLEDRHFNNWTIELGLRGEYQKIDPEDTRLEQKSYTTWSASAATIWSINDDNNLTLALSIAQRAPFAEELYSNVVNIGSDTLVEHAATGAVEIGDPELDSETSHNFELGWTHFGDRYSSSLNVFYNNFSDYIYLANTGLIYNPDECSVTAVCGPEQADEGPPVLVYTQQAALFRGIEAEISVPLWPDSGNEFSLDFYGDYTRATLEDSGEGVPRMPPARIGARFNFDVRNWSGFVRLNHGFEQDNPGANETTTAGFTRIDAGVFYDFDRGRTQWQLFAKANNLGNAEIRNSASYLRNYAPEPGRGFELGLNLNF
jgi:iron complex outermembrane receptor protein